MKRIFLGVLALGLATGVTDAFGQNYTTPYPGNGAATISPGPIGSVPGGYAGYGQPGLPYQPGTGVVNSDLTGGLPGGFTQTGPIYEDFPPAPRWGGLGRRFFGWRRGSVSLPYYGGPGFEMTVP